MSGYSIVFLTALYYTSSSDLISISFGDNFDSFLFALFVAQKVKSTVDKSVNTIGIKPRHKNGITNIISFIIFIIIRDVI